MKSINRRNFLLKSSASIAGLSLASNSFSNNSATNQNKAKVITRKLGKTGIEIPVLSLGCGQVDSDAVVKAAIKVGINHFDTAYIYQRGNSEKLLGKILSGIDRKSYTIATKVKPQDSVEKFLEMLDMSLKRLQTDYVDILYMHSLTSRDQVLSELNIKAAQKAKELGKAKFIGVSTHKNEPVVIQAVIDSDFYDVILTAINFKQEHYLEIKEKLAVANSKGIGVVGMKVMAGGYLDTEKTKPVNHLAALKWVLDDKNIHTTIPSMVNLEQLQVNMKILSSVEMTEKEMKDVAYAKEEMGLYCNGCSRCVSSCTKQLPIPEFMRAFMYSYGYKSSLKAKELINELNLGSNPCEGCNDCSVNCVKSFNVALKIKDISQLIDIPNRFLV